MEGRFLGKWVNLSDLEDSVLWFETEYFLNLKKIRGWVKGVCCNLVISKEQKL